jgi:hypothetical protein
MLMTASGDGKLKTWDISGGKPSLVYDLQQNLGALLCLDACPDLPFVACVGGENKRRNFAVIDVMDISAGKQVTGYVRMIPLTFINLHCSLICSTASSIQSHVYCARILSCQEQMLDWWHL